MIRGEVVLARLPGSPAAKARPCVVVQRSSVLAAATKVTLCPLTSVLRGIASERPFVAAHPDTGLRVPSEVEVDWIFTTPIDRILARLGRLDEGAMREIDAALRRWLEL